MRQSGAVAKIEPRPERLSEPFDYIEWRKGGERRLAGAQAIPVLLT